MPEERKSSVESVVDSVNEIIVLILILERAIRDHGLLGRLQPIDILRTLRDKATAKRAAAVLVESTPPAVRYGYEKDSYNILGDVEPVANSEDLVLEFVPLEVFLGGEEVSAEVLQQRAADQNAAGVADFGTAKKFFEAMRGTPGVVIDDEGAIVTIGGRQVVFAGTLLNTRAFIAFSYETTKCFFVFGLVPSRSPLLASYFEARAEAVFEILQRPNEYSVACFRRKLAASSE